MRARDLTAEIDQATDLAAKERNLALEREQAQLMGLQAMEQRQNVTELGRNRAGLGQNSAELRQGRADLGQNRAGLGRSGMELTGNGAALGQGETESLRNEVGFGRQEAGFERAGVGLAREGAELRRAEAELKRDEQELKKPLEFVGEESKLQSRERMADDAEDARNEMGEGLRFENRIVAKNQEAVAQAVVPEVDKIMSQKSFRPALLDKLYREGVGAALEVFGRRIGDRNQ